MATPNKPIVLWPMRHQGYIQRQKEDWAGITDPKRRKKLQNRLNQRARRQRQPAKTAEAEAADALERDTNEQLTVVQTRARLERFALEAMQSYMLHRPNTNHLVQVIKLNTINALTANAAALRLPVDWLICNAMSPFGLVGPPMPATDTGGGRSFAGPASLIPTALQRRIPHHPWIDLFPLARMRNNWLLAIYVSESLSEDEEVQLWDDLVEWGDESGGGDGAGLVVWGEPSDPRSWEVTVPFLRRWGRLLQGCGEILEATNYWRQSRGERCLCFKT